MFPYKNKKKKIEKEKKNVVKNSLFCAEITQTKPLKIYIMIMGQPNYIYTPTIRLDLCR